MKYGSMRSDDRIDTVPLFVTAQTPVHIHIEQLDESLAHSS